MKRTLSSICVVILCTTGFPQATGTFTDDRDGREYKTVKIGNQVWMAENLCATRYTNGDPVPNITDNAEWENVTAGSNKTGAYCVYENNSAYGKIYGNLYNWYAVNDKRGLAPMGWHIPTKTEWEQLFAYLGGMDAAAGKLKEKGTTHYISLNSTSEDAAEFTALPGGCRDESGMFYFLKYYGYWWSATESDVFSAWDLIMGYDSDGIITGYIGKLSGCSVRCIKDR